MKFVSYNIQYCKGKDDRYDIDRIIREIEDADIVALQEVDRFWKRSGYTDQVEKIAEGLKDYYWVYGAGIDMHASLAICCYPDRLIFRSILLLRYS